ncbi:hypothetical protein ACFL4T_03695 [candidate division KSB1 bacterium]
MEKNFKGKRFVRITAGVVFILLAMVCIYYLPTVIGNSNTYDEAAAQKLSAYTDSLFAASENKLAAGKEVKGEIINQKAFERYQKALETLKSTSKDKPRGKDETLIGNLKYKEGDFNLKLFMVSYDPEYLDKSIRIFNEVQKQIKPEENTSIYRLLHFSLGNAYLFQKAENQKEKLNRVVNAYSEALKYSDNKTPSDQKGLTLYNLGYAYGFLSGKDDIKSKNKAIEYFMESLKIFNAAMYPGRYKDTHNRMGIVYFQLSRIEDREENLLKSAESFQESIRFHDTETLTDNYALNLNLLGLTYETLAAIKERGANLKKALDAYIKALDVYRNITDPEYKYTYLIKHLPERIEIIEKELR